MSFSPEDNIHVDFSVRLSIRFGAESPQVCVQASQVHDSTQRRRVGDSIRRVGGVDSRRPASRYNKIIIAVGRCPEPLRGLVGHQPLSRCSGWQVP